MCGEKVMKKSKIMIVEDESVIAMELKQRLMDMGYLVPSIVYSGRQALDIIDEIEPDLILLDIKLPGEFNGIETAQIIQKVYEIPIIFCTGYKDEEIRKTALATNPCGYLVKPYEDIILKSTIEKAFSLNLAGNNLRNDLN